MRSSRAGAASLVLLALVCYLPVVLKGGFILDDDIFITQNPLLRAPDGLSRIWFSADGPHYYPLLLSLLRLEFGLWGTSAPGYHLVNALVHGLNAVLAWRLFKRLGFSWAWWAAGLWALHPVQVESVAWATEAKNVFSGFFGLAALLAFLESEDGRGPRWYLASLALFAASLFCKTVTAVLPGVLLVLRWMRGRRLDRAWLVSLLPFLALGAGLGLFSAYYERSVIRTLAPVWTLTALQHLLLAARIPFFYLGKLAWPFGLSFFYPRWEVDPGRWTHWLPLAGLLGGSYGLWARRERLGREPLAAALCFLGILFPVLGFFFIGFMNFSFVADHFQYLASLPALALAVGALSRAKAPGAARAAALALLGLLTWGRAAVFAGPETLWQDTIAKNPRAFRAYTNLANEELARGRPEQAVRLCREALALAPEDEAAHTISALALAAQGDLEGAVAHYAASARLKPGDVGIRHNLGKLLMALKRPREAELQFREAARHHPESALAFNDLGWTLAAQGRGKEAVAAYRRAVALDPGRSLAWFNLGNLLAARGRLDEAAACFERVLALDPRDEGARLSLRKVAELKRAGARSRPG